MFAESWLKMLCHTETNYEDDMSDNYDDRKFDDAMITQMKNQLGDSICTVKFKKADDSEREMKCTTNIRYIPEEKMPKKSDEGNNDRKLFIVFDTDINEWRSFRYERIISFFYPGNAPSNYPPGNRVFP